jgi:hypothetical protein
LRFLGGGKEVLLSPIIVWPAAGRIGIVKTAADILSAEKKIIREEERARRRREIKIIR